MKFHKRKPYSELSCRRRKRMYIKTKNKIRRAAPHLGGLFFSHDYMHGQNGWIDCLFIGKNKVVYNCVLDTTRNRYKEAVFEAACDRADELVPRDYKFTSTLDPATGLYELHMAPDLAEPAFGGLTRHEWRQQEEQRIADSGEIKVFEKVSLHRDYHFGVGLHATLNVPFITVAAVNAFIAKFIADGERGSGNAEPFTYQHDEIAHWGIDSNAIVDPCEHPPSEETTD